MLKKTTTAKTNKQTNKKKQQKKKLALGNLWNSPEMVKQNKNNKTG